MDYSAKDIQVLEGLEAVRKRPAMYIGDVGKRGFHHLVFEIVDNSIDEALAGYASKIVVEVWDKEVVVKDDGRGIPVDIHESGKSALEIVTTILHAGGKFQKKAYKVSGGLHGVGISVVNALSEWMEVIVKRDGKVYRQKYSKGTVITPVEVIGETNETGTVVKFKPDPEIFGDQCFDPRFLAERLEELSFLNRGIEITFIDHINDVKKVFFHKGGIREFVEKLSKGKEHLHDIVFFSKCEGGNEIELSFVYTNSYSSILASYVNSIKTIEGGTHLTGFRAGLTRALNDYAKKMSLIKDKRFSGEDVLEGLVAVINLKVMEPQFEGQTKTKLGNADIKGIVERMTFESIKRYLEEHPSLAKAIIAKCIHTMETRLAAQKAKDLLRRKSALDSGVLPGKLADCIERDAEKAELFIVEGDSAGGSAKQGRDRRFQAILPLKGKILNVEKANLRKMLDNKEIRALLTAMGCNFGDQIDLSKLRYHKIIIMTDADVDGAHIRTLLLTFFYRYLLPIIEKGYLYIATPPLYKVKTGKRVRYLYSDEELQSLLKEVNNPEIQRYKGLGEMNPQQLWDTTMNPETRILKKVTIQDAEEANKLFSILMGEDVEPRRNFIQKHAKYVRNLDI